MSHRSQSGQSCEGVGYSVGTGPGQQVAASRTPGKRLRAAIGLTTHLFPAIEPFCLPLAAPLDLGP